jgi:hypothetical protein
MSLKKLLFLIALIFSFAKNTNACSCAITIPDDFFASLSRVASFQFSKYSIVKIKLLETTGGYGARFQLLEHYCGQPVPGTSIIWGDPGFLCRVTPQSEYHCPGDTIIAIMSTVGSGWELPNEDSNDYEISICGYFHLLVKGNKVYGGNSTSFSYNGYPLSMFMDSLNATLRQLPCPVPLPPIPGFTIHNNPSGGKFTTVTSRGGTLVVYNMLGQVTASYVVNSGKNTLELPGSLSKGIYMVSFSADGTSTRKTLPLLYQ